MSQKIIDRIQGTVNTTDALTQQTAVSYPVPANAAYYAEYTLVGRDTTSGDTVAAKGSAVLNRVSGTLAVIGSVTSVLPMTGTAAIVASTSTLDVSGDNIRVRVNGVIAKTIEWLVDLRIWIN